MAWITCNTVNTFAAPLRYRWLAALCTAAVLCSLVAHLTADVIAIPLEPNGPPARGRIAAGEYRTQCDLLGEIALPATFSVVSLSRLTLPVNTHDLTRLTWITMPPVRPPITTH